MRPNADEVQVITIDLVYQQPIRLDVAVTVVLPVAAERVILAALLRELHIPPKLRPDYRVSQIRFPGF